MTEQCPVTGQTYPASDPFSSLSPNSTVGRTVSGLLTADGPLSAEIFDPLFPQTQNGSGAYVRDLGEAMLDRAQAEPPTDEQALQDRIAWYGNTVQIMRRPWLVYKTALAISTFASRIADLELHGWQPESADYTDHKTETATAGVVNMIEEMNKDAQNSQHPTTEDFEAILHISYASERYGFGGYAVEESLGKYRGLINACADGRARDAMLNRYASFVATLPPKLQYPVMDENRGVQYREALRTALHEGSSDAYTPMTDFTVNVMPAVLQIATAVADGRRRQIAPEVLASNLADNVDVAGRVVYAADQLAATPVASDFRDGLRRAMTVGPRLCWDDSGTRLVGHFSQLKDSYFTDRAMSLPELYDRAIRSAGNPHRTASKYAHKLRLSGGCLVRYAVQLEPDMQTPFRSLAAHMEQDHGGRPDIIDDNGVLYPARATFAFVLDRLLHDGIVSGSPEWAFLDNATEA